MYIDILIISYTHKQHTIMEPIHVQNLDLRDAFTNSTINPCTGHVACSGLVFSLTNADGVIETCRGRGRREVSLRLRIRSPLVLWYLKHAKRNYQDMQDRLPRHESLLEDGDILTCRPLVSSSGVMRIRVLQSDIHTGICDFPYINEPIVGRSVQNLVVEVYKFNIIRKNGRVVCCHSLKLRSLQLGEPDIID